MVSSPVQEFLQATRHRIASFSSARRWPGDHPHRGQAQWRPALHRSQHGEGPVWAQSPAGS